MPCFRGVGIERPGVEILGRTAKALFAGSTLVVLALALAGQAFAGVGPPSVGEVSAEYLEGRALPLDALINPEGSETQFAFWVQTPTETYSFGAGRIRANAGGVVLLAYLRHVRPKSSFRVWIEASNASGSAESAHMVVVAEHAPRGERERGRETEFTLILDSAGTRARVNTPTGADFKLSVLGADCEQTVSGKLKDNGSHDDRASFPMQDPQQSCDDGASLEGQISRIDLFGGSCFEGGCERAPGGPLAIRFKPNLQMTLPGPCVYRVGALDGHHGEPHAGLGETELGEVGEGEAELVTALSSATCARSALIEAQLEVSDLETHALYEGQEPL